VALLLAVTAAVAAAAATRVGAQAAACEVDYALAIDESRSINPREFDTARAFVRSIITAAAARSAAARFSLVTFASSTTVIATGVDAAAATAAMDAHPKGSGGTRIDRALTAAAATLMAGDGSGGATRGRALILITDGASAPEPARAAAAVAKADGIAIVTVAVGGNTDEALLAELASDPTLVFQGEVDALVGLVGELVTDTCAVVAPPTETPKATPEVPTATASPEATPSSYYYRAPSAAPSDEPSPSEDAVPEPTATPSSPLPNDASYAPSPPPGRACTVTDFSGLYRGSPVTGGPGWSLKVTRGIDDDVEGAAAAPDVSAAFNSSSPPDADSDIGTPGECGGGPGVGAGGAAGAPGANCDDRGMLVIASAADNVDVERATCAAACGPAAVGPGGAPINATACAAACPGNDFWGGATFTMRFCGEVGAGDEDAPGPVTVTGVTMLDVDAGEVLDVDVVGGGAAAYERHEGLGANAVQALTLSTEVPHGSALRIRCSGSCALMQVRWC